MPQFWRFLMRAVRTLVREFGSNRRSPVPAVSRTAHVDALLAHLPADDPDRAALQARATTYSRDCGCTIGAAFLAGSLPLAFAYFTLTGGLSIRRGIAGLLFVLIASLSGKAAGLVLASLKLALLRRSILRKIRAQEYLKHVHVH
jgi:hypothetical protein